MSSLLCFLPLLLARQQLLLSWLQLHFFCDSNGTALPSDMMLTWTRMGIAEHFVRSHTAHKTNEKRAAVQ